MQHVDDRKCVAAVTRNFIISQISSHAYKTFVHRNRYMYAPRKEEAKLNIESLIMGNKSHSILENREILVKWERDRLLCRKRYCTTLHIPDDLSFR
jgi:hypothetical protein